MTSDSQAPGMFTDWALDHTSGSALPGSRSVWVSGSEGERVLGRLGLVGGTGGGCAAERGAAWSFCRHRGLQTPRGAV